jgi:hypothetical protein
VLFVGSRGGRAQRVVALAFTACLRAHRFDGVEGKATGKHRYPIKQALVVRTEQLVAPRHGRLECLLANRRGSDAAHQKLETIVQSCRKLLWRKHVDARRRELHGQRQPVETAANLSDRHCVGERQREVRRRRLRPFDEQAHRINFGQVLERRQGIVRSSQWSHLPGDLAWHAERLATGNQQVQSGASPHETLDKFGARVDQMLAVVQDKKNTARADGRDQRLDHRLARSDRDSYRRGNSHGNQASVGDGPELDQPDAVGKVDHC